MTNKQSMEHVINLLEDIQRRPLLYFDEYMPPVLNFLSGFYVALGKIDEYSRDVYRKIQIERNWEVNSLHPVMEMIRRGMDKDAVITEALTLELEMWKRLLAELPNNE